MSIPMDSLPRPVAGYPKLAQHMGTYSECAIFRRFNALNSQNLLYLQAELVYLEQELERLEILDSASAEGNRSVYSKDWYWLENSASEGSGDQLRAVLEIRSKLKQYNDAVIQQSVMNRLETAPHHDLRQLQEWLERPEMGNCTLLGADRDTWGAASQPLGQHSGLLTLNIGHPEDDAFSRWFAVNFLSWFHHLLGRRVQKPQDPESGVASYKEETIRKFTSQITTIISSLLPVLAIVALRCVKSADLQIGLITIFSLVFTSCMTIFTTASRGEIFIGTSTFAAVQVVFVSASTTDA